ncbi:MAG: hypothetical protein ACLP1X_21430 [Polyangiaceae bacterium]
MRHRLQASIAATLTSISVLLAATSARAADPTTSDCLTANEGSIKLRADHRLREARAQLLICAAASCPADIRNACTQRVGKVNDAIPTVVFEVKDANDNELTAVAVTIDGQPLVARLEGTAISLDPGEHVFGFEAAGQAKVEKRLVIHEGEKDRRERVVMGGAAVAPPAPVVAAAPASAAPVGEAKMAPAQATGLPMTSAPAPASTGSIPEPSPDSAVHVSFVAPDDTTPWSLHTKDGELVCALPCTRWIAPASKSYLQRDTHLATVDSKPLQIQVPDDLPYPIGSAVAATPNAARGSVVGSVLAGLSSAIMVLGGSVLYFAEEPHVNEAGFRDGASAGIAIAIVGGVGLAASFAWFLWSHGDGVETAPMPTGAGASTFTLRPTPTGLGGTF